MGYKFTKLSDVPVVAEFPEGANAIIEADGEIKRCPSAGGSAENVQTDYNQNDSTAADYLKNRPFYTGDPVETMLVEESTVSFAEEDGGIYAAQLPSTFELTIGEAYTVYWDGVAYECSCADFDGRLYLGNLSIAGAGSDTSEPFLIVSEGKGTMIGTVDTSASHAISISGLVTEIVKIDSKYLPFPFKPDGESYLTLSSRNSFILEMPGTNDGTLEYFASDGTWAVWDGMSAISAIANGGAYVIYLRGTGNTVITNNASWYLEGSDISCIGNIENLLDYATVASGEHPIMADYCYGSMFEDCTGLIQAPELPATTLVYGCYYEMFRGCTNLTQAPKLPATTLATSCYCSMFSGCTSLTKVPELPVTTLADSCYNYMFSRCTSLTQAPVLPATTVASRCYDGMFRECASLAQAPKLPATTLASNCYCDMFRDCTSLIQVPELSAITLADYCYDNMFTGCISLKLSTTKTEEYTQEYRIPSSGDGVIATSAFINMFASTGGTFTGTPSINTTYYLSSNNMIVRGNDIANLNGYVQTMIDNTEYIIPSSAPNSTKKFKITVDDNGTITATEVT